VTTLTALEGKAILDHGKAIARRYAGRVGADVADELGAEAVLRALRSPPPDGRFEPWLERIYRNLIVDVWRRRKPATLDIADVRGLAVSGTPEDAVLARERRRAVRASVAQLPREARRALLSRYYGEVDDDVSASRLGIAGATMRTRIHRALERLRGRLGDLRGLLPPAFGKLGAHVGAIALAPLMIFALVVVPVSSRAPEVEISRSAAIVADHHATQAARPAVAVARDDVPAVVVERRKRVRALARIGAAVRQEAPAQIIAFVERDEVVADILRPETLDIFADPVQAVRPCLVEAPPDFLGQFEKMVEDSL
jgi:RNA polymerase sigma factor (sigma-70 family)